MNSIGRKLAIRKALCSEYPLARAPQSYFGNAMRMMQSIRSHNRFCTESFRVLRRNQRMFSLDDSESQFLRALLNQGYAISPSFFSKEIVDRIYAKADAIFHKMALGHEDRVFVEISARPGKEHGVRDGSRARERTLELVDPLISIPDVLDIAFHESLLKIAAHFFLHIPRLYKVSLVRHFPNHRPKCLAGLQRDDQHGSLNIMIDLVDIDDARGPFVYVPGAQNCLTLDKRPAPAPSLPFREQGYVSDQESTPSRSKWVVLRGERGTVVGIPGSGTRGSIWTYPADVNNKPRTSIMIHISGYNPGDRPVMGQNRILKWNFDRMTGLQQMFAYPGIVDEPAPGLAKAG
jgi:phytanoyl-CoA dioxygenase PhyH